MTTVNHGKLAMERYRRRSSSRRGSLDRSELHSGPETDIRDVLAIAEEIDLEMVTPHLHRGDENALRQQLEYELEIFLSEELNHGFRSDFGTATVSTETVTDLEVYLSERIDQLSTESK